MRLYNKATGRYCGLFFWHGFTELRWMAREVGWMDALRWHRANGRTFRSLFR